MGQISLLHIGDIHFSSNEIYKTPSNPREIQNYTWSKLSDDEKTDLLQYLIRKIKKSLFLHIEEENFDSVIITGDLCRQGILPEYDSCLKYLKIQFQNFSNSIPQNKVEISAGNHDLISYIPFDEDHITARFLPFCELLECNGYRQYATDNVDVTIIEKNEGKIILLNINSCLHFRDLSLLQPSHRETIQKMIRRGGEQQDFNRLLNVPYIPMQLIDEICRIIQEHPDCLPIIFTHHNFLRIGNFDPNREYDGIINEGPIIQRLESLNRSILILHGHIHYCDKKESGSIGARIVFSSAPLFFPQKTQIVGEMYGYKILHIIFADDELRTPLGCEIKSYTLKGCNVVAEESIKIPFIDPSDSVESLNLQEIPIYRVISQLRNEEYLGDCLKKLRRDGTIPPESEYSNETFISVINNLSWRKLIVYKENKSNPLRGIIQGRIP
jgi:Icc-related predicted phosphoesterase